MVSRSHTHYNRVIAKQERVSGHDATFRCVSLSCTMFRSQLKLRGAGRVFLTVIRNLVADCRI